MEVQQDHIEEEGLGTFEDPVIVTRDNPQFEGLFPWVSGDASQGEGVWSHVYEWFGGSVNGGGGDVVIHEFMEDETFVSQGWTAFRPVSGSRAYDLGDFDGLWASRSGKLIHGRVFEIGYHSGAVVSEDPAFVKLSDEVLLVPVFVTSWVHPETQEIDYSTRAAALIDFMPFVHPSNATYEYQCLPAEDPEFHEPPVDEIWAQCGIQFQIIGMMRANNRHPQGHYYCDTDEVIWPWGPNNVNPEDGTDAFIADMDAWWAIGPEKGAQIRNELFPIFANYGPLDCQFGHGKAYAGAINRIYVHNGYRSNKAYTAHELGHILGLDHVSTSANLMHEDVGPGALEQWQCDIARAGAAGFSERYREYNGAVERTPSPIVDWPGGTPSPGGTTGLDGDVCCELGGEQSFVPIVECNFLGGTKVNPEKCYRCCKVGPGQAGLKLPGECSFVLPETSCFPVCCSVRGSSCTSTMSQYNCYLSGGWPVPCQPC